MHSQMPSIGLTSARSAGGSWSSTDSSSPQLWVKFAISAVLAIQSIGRRASLRYFSSVAGGRLSSSLVYRHKKTSLSMGATAALMFCSVAKLSSLPYTCNSDAAEG